MITMQSMFYRADDLILVNCRLFSCLIVHRRFYYTEAWEKKPPLHSSMTTTGRLTLFWCSRIRQGGPRLLNLSQRVAEEELWLLLRHSSKILSNI